MATPGYAVLLDFLSARHVVSAFVDEAVKPADINGGDFAIYALLAGIGPQTPQRLARIVGLPATTLSTQAKRLEERGHVRRTPHGQDGRSHLLELTAEGRDTHCQAAGMFLAAYDALERELPAAIIDIRIALRLLEEASRRVMGNDNPGAYRVNHTDKNTASPKSLLSAQFQIESEPSILDADEEQAIATALTESSAG